jgi:sugar phosphate isomerase/epimerase
MKFGVCIAHSQAASIRDAGWDFVEENVQSLLKGSESSWQPPTGVALPIPAANSMVPATIPIVGPNVDRAKVQAYMTNVLQRAKQVGMQTIVFGSGGARNVPDGFDRNKAVSQIDEFLGMIAPIAQSNGVTIVIEPLNRSECNILNSVGEAMTYVKRLNHPGVKCLVDSYHFWLEDEPLKNLEEAMPSIAHVHVADRDGRTPPGESGTADYKPFFKVLKQGGYDKLISVECRGFDVPTHGKKILDYLKTNWAAA